MSGAVDLHEARIDTAPHERLARNPPPAPETCSCRYRPRSRSRAFARHARRIVQRRQARLPARLLSLMQPARDVARARHQHRRIDQPAALPISTPPIAAPPGVAHVDDTARPVVRCAAPRSRRRRPRCCRACSCRAGDRCGPGWCGRDRRCSRAASARRRPCPAAPASSQRRRDRWRAAVGNIAVHHHDQQRRRSGRLGAERRDRLAQPSAEHPVGNALRPAGNRHAPRYSTAARQTDRSASTIPRGQIMI